jgi:hypothetical protein
MSIAWKCPYCKFECAKQQELKEHFIAEHYFEMKTIGMRNEKPKTVSWAAAWKSTFCSYQKKD